MADRTLLNGDVPITNGQIAPISAKQNGDGHILSEDDGININGDIPDTRNDNYKSHDIKEPPDGGARAWLVMISAFFCNGVIFGIINTCSIVHSHLDERLRQMQDTQASSKAALVSSLAIGTTFLLSPISGVLTDKIGLRTTTLIGGILAASGMFLSSFFSHNIEALYLTYGVMFGMGGALTYTPTLAILGHYFKRYLGITSGFVTAGSSVFTTIMPAGISYLVKECGLSVTLQTMGALACFILIASFIYKPLHRPLPASAHAKPGRSAAKVLFRSVINVDIWKRKRYVIWALSVPLALFGYFVPYVHMVKFVETKYKGENSNLPVMIIGISSGVGRLLFGFLSDMKRVNRILLQQVALACIGFFTMLLPVTNSYTLLLIMVFCMGLFDGCFVTLLGPIAYEICGPRGATQGIGFLLGLSSIPLTVGPPIAGKIFDSTGSYTMPLMLAGVPPIVGALLICMVHCVRNDSSANEIADKNANNGTMSKSAWDSEFASEKLMPNGNNHHENSNRKASLAAAESLSDMNGTEKLNSNPQ